MDQISRRNILKGVSAVLAASGARTAGAVSSALRAIEIPAGDPGSLPGGPAWLRSAVFYQVYPQSFFDSDNDGVGDLPGLISKLDYIRSIGCNAVWINPIFDSPFGDAGYDISNFVHVAPRYGINDDIRVLANEAHARGMRICLDLVAGHTSIQHPWFRQSMRSESNEFSDWFIWTPAEEMLPNTYPPPRLGSENIRKDRYVPNFFPFQPALNYGYFKPDSSKPWQHSMQHPACRKVQENLRQVMKYWLDLGIDGFRVDMASSLIRNDPDGEGIRQLWHENRTWLQEHYPEAVLVSEWGHPAASILAGFNIDFLLHFGQTGYIDLVGPQSPPSGDSRTPDAFFERSGRGDITKFVRNYMANFEPTRALGYIALPTGNHDFPRPTWGRNEEDVRVLFAMLLTMPGVPFLYYGDEIGMRFQEHAPEKEGANRGGMRRSGSRTPMQWTSGINAGFSGAPAADLYLPIDPNPDRPNVEAQERAADSMLNFTRNLLHLRKSVAALSNVGGFRVIHAESLQTPFVYERSMGDQRVVVAINPAATRSEIRVPGVALKPLLIQSASLDNETLQMEPVSFGIFGP